MKTNSVYSYPLIWIVLILFLTAGSELKAQTIIDLKDYGIVPNSFENASHALVRAIADAKKEKNAVIRFPGGRIDLWPQGTRSKEYFVSNTTEADSLTKVKSVGILLDNMHNITLEGNNTLVMIHGKMVHLAIDNSSGIKVKDLQFDYERPTMSEMEVLELNDNAITVRVHKDSKYWMEEDKVSWYGQGWKAKKANMHLIIYRPSLETMYYGDYTFLANGKAAEIAPNTLRYTGDFSNVKYRVGDILTFRDVYRDYLGILNHFSNDISFKNIQIHYMHGMGMVSQFSKNIHIDNFIGKPRDDSGRTIAAFADFLHFSGCYGEITVENSLFSGSHDDGINVHGTHLRVISHKDNTIKVRFMHHQTWNLMAFEPGDSIGLVNNKTLIVYDFAKIKKVSKINPRELELTLDRPVSEELREGHVVENLTKTPKVTIRNNRFEHTNTRGILMTTRKKVLIENNTFFRTGMHAILIADDANSWYESGPVTDVTIRNNKFVECGYNSFPNTYPIAIMPEAKEFAEDRYVHSNIHITDNEFSLFAPPLLFARATKKLTFENNHITGQATKDFPLSEKPMFFLEHCANVDIVNNQFDTQFSEKNIQLEHMQKGQLKYRPKRPFKLIESVHKME
ncbi:right-handed parallel beta-helix repeat-containing protein [Galbibacter sp.]|uniref:right-handed parallel beta-helix repeat-containing protein n=1 Tax=Galbibacter sp. TaxID=2918471 RepID=UPI003A8C9DF2